MQLQLNIRDRIYIPALLPSQGTFMEFNLKRDIIKKVALTESDKKKYSIVEDRERGQVKWDIEKDNKEPLNVTFTEAEMEYLKKGCEELSTASYPDDFWMTVEKIYNVQ